MEIPCHSPKIRMITAFCPWGPDILINEGSDNPPAFQSSRVKTPSNQQHRGGAVGVLFGCVVRKQDYRKRNTAPRKHPI